MVLRQLIEEKRDEILRLAVKHAAQNVRLFGSVARGEDGPDSDVDFLVEVGPTTSSWFPAGLILDLEQALGRRVEIVTDQGLNPYLRDQVLLEAVPL